MLGLALILGTPGVMGDTLQAGAEPFSCRTGDLHRFGHRQLTCNSGNLFRLGERQFTCKKGELRLYGDAGNKNYPPGKHEKIRLRKNTGILAYTCRGIRGIVPCPIDTTVFEVKRDVYAGKFNVVCLGVPVLTEPELTKKSSIDAGERSSGDGP